MADTWPFLLGAGATNFSLKFDYDGNGNQIYVGWAQPGSASSAAVWRIMKQTFDGSNQQTDLQWANSSPAFKFVWDDRTTYTYA